MNSGATIARIERTMFEKLIKSSSSPKLATTRKVHTVMVEMVFDKRMRGWLQMADPQPTEVPVTVGEVALSCPVLWSHRADIADATGPGGELLKGVGFDIDVSGFADADVDVLRLQDISILGTRVQDLRTGIYSFLEIDDELRIKGWVADSCADLRPEARGYSIALGGREFQLSPVFHHRADLLPFFSQWEPSAVRGVMAALPLDIYEVLAQEPMTAQLVIDGTPQPTVLRLDKSELRQRILSLLGKLSQLAPLRDALKQPETVRQVATVMEHVEAAGWAEGLPPQQDSLLREAQKLLGLQRARGAGPTRVPPSAQHGEGAASAPGALSTPSPPEDWPVEESEVHYHLQQLRKFDEESNEWGVTTAFEARLADIAQALNSRLIDRFASAVLPSVILEEKALTILSAHTSLERLARSNARASAWGRCVALAILARQRDWKPVTKHLVYLARTPQEWAPYACILFATRQVVEELGRPGFDRGAVDDFCRKLVALIDSQSSYFGRSDDRSLIASVVLLLEQGDRMRHVALNSLLALVTRVYAFSTDFWQAVSWKNITHPVVKETLEALEARVETLRKIQALSESERREHHLLLFDALSQFFERHENRDIARVRREFSPARLAAHGQMFEAGVGSPGEQALRDLFHPMRGEQKPRFERSLLAVRSDTTTPCLPRVAENLEQLLSLDPAEPVPDAHLKDRLAAFERAEDQFSILCWLLGQARLNRFGPHWMDAHRRLREIKQKPEAQRTPEERAGWARLDPGGRPSKGTLHSDVIVCVFSCQAHLETHIPLIRRHWLERFAAAGIPVQIFVGGEPLPEDKPEVVRLSCPDTYEALPQKTLAMMRWVQENTSAQYIFKIDDDCFTTPETLLGDLEYRRHHYWGRKIKRDFGQTPRNWHQTKSQTATAQLAFDKSPELSVFCDGGGGYMVSRHALEQLLAVADSPRGAELVLASYFEDKMVGDLLSLHGIKPSDHHYRTHQRRRTHADGTPFERWENNYYPVPSGQVRLAHLDDVSQLESAADIFDQERIWPRKIWPTHLRAGLFDAENQDRLELLSPLSRLEAVTHAEAPVVVACVFNEALILPNFLAHYRALGVGGFLFADNRSDDGTREYLLSQPDVALYAADFDYNKSEYGVTWQQALLAHHRFNKWSIVADADELLVFPGMGSRSLQEHLSAIEASGLDAVRCFMIDMYPHGELSSFRVDQENPLEADLYFDEHAVRRSHISVSRYARFPNHVSQLRHRLLRSSSPSEFTAQKLCILRYNSSMKLSAGLHDVANIRLHEQPFCLAHLKYHAHFYEKVVTEVERGQHYAGAAEYRKYLTMMAETQRMWFEGSRPYEGPESFEPFFDIRD